MFMDEDNNLNSNNKEFDDRQNHEDNDDDHLNFDSNKGSVFSNEFTDFYERTESMFQQLNQESTPVTTTIGQIKQCNIMKPSKDNKDQQNINDSPEKERN